MKKVIIYIITAALLILPIRATAEAEKELTGIELISAEDVQLQYLIGEELNTKGLTIKASYSDGSEEEVPVTEDMVSGFDSSALGARLLTIMYKTRSAVLSVSIVEEYTTEIETERPPLDGFDTNAAEKPSEKKDGMPSGIIVALCVSAAAIVGVISVYTIVKKKDDE